MSIQLPEYTIQAKTNHKPTNVKVVIAVAIVVSLLAGYLINDFFSNDTIKTLQQRNDVLETTNTQNQDKIVQLEASVSLLKTEQKVKQQAIIEVQNDYKEMTDQVNFLKSEINFYERLLSPNEENKGLRVFQANATTIADNRFGLKVVLVQKIQRAREISGRFEVTLTGQQNGEKDTLTLSDSDHDSYAFKYFHHISLGFSIPEGFNAEQLVVKLYPKDKKAKTVNYAVDWHTIIQ